MSQIVKLILTNYEPTWQQLANLIGFIDFVPTIGHPDVYDVRETDNASIGIDQIKSFTAWVGKQPYQESTKIGVIWQADKLTEQAQNSLLKILEEHPSSTTIVLVAKSKNYLLQTVLSRVSIINRVEEEQQSKYGELVNQFMTSNYWERQKLIDSELKNLSRAQLQELLLENMRFLKSAFPNIGREKWLKNLNIIESALLANKSSVNTSLILDNLLYLEV